ncbi:hypothetical protein [Actinoallomurus iriomotensis]|uniref:Uncharacterized protein n=1 Tax=Actinoallomurus iriomotensis TaxID=478107 RepID=A0A9W6RUN8_9ACTN|nr:hypothetical protein [Actinoallomurus iriomotensis]GLY81884.1 hypothetical protein Airi01_101510 [Actinoallomurus iriomotensis]
MTNLIAFPSAAAASHRTPAVTATVDEAVVVQLLAARWPIGTRVRHKHSMWLGTIVPGNPETCPGAYVGIAPAHAYVAAMANLEPGVVCVQWDHPDTQPGFTERGPVDGPWPHPRIGLAWIRPGVLRVVRERERRTR